METKCPRRAQTFDGGSRAAGNQFPGIEAPGTQRGATDALHRPVAVS